MAAERAKAEAYLADVRAVWFVLHHDLNLFAPADQQTVFHHHGMLILQLPFSPSSSCARLKDQNGHRRER